MDTITISGLELWTHIGVPEEERALEQRVLVDIVLRADCTEVAKTDDVEQGIDYFAVYNDVRNLAKEERKTIEKLAEDIASYILEHYRPEQIEVVVKKFILPGTEHVSVSIVRP